MKTWDTATRFWYEANDGKRIKFKTLAERDAFLGIEKEQEPAELELEIEDETFWPSK